nr:HU family DNA-binding protein [uncultured Desulfobulbus sp.]
MNKGELITILAGECGMSKEATGKVVNSLLTIISQALATEDKVKLVGFGTFTVSRRPARRVRLPQTGKLIEIPARKSVRFKPGAQIRESVQAQELDP